MIELDRIYNEDCLIGMQRIPDGSVDCIVCDLPYGTMKGAALDGWEGTKTDWDEIIPTDQLFEQYERILRMNGVAILFSQEPYTSHLRTYQYKNSNFQFAYPMIWKKNHFANGLIGKVAPVSYFEDINVFVKRYDASGHHPLRGYFKRVLQYITVPKSQLMKDIGDKIDHTFRLDSMQFDLCTEDTYEELRIRYRLDNMEGFMPYIELQKIDKRFQRTFNLPEGQGHFSNILEFSKDTDGFHPTQKPVALIRRLIQTYSNEGDTILDNCMGSGTTAIAAIREKRHFIGFELNAEYYDKAKQRIKNEQSQLKLF